jgi:hypothetical protein
MESHYSFLVPVRATLRYGDSHRSLGDAKPYVGLMACEGQTWFTATVAVATVLRQ